MIASVFRFEIAYQLRRPSTYLYFGLLFLISFLALTTIGPTGHVAPNAPFNIADMTVNVTEFAQIVTAAFVGLLVLRDYAYHSHELFFTTRLTKASYLGGRFAGALVVLALMFSAIPLGIFLATLSPWVDHAALLPFHAWHYVSPYLTLVLPTLFVIACLFFAAGIVSRSPLTVHVLGFALVMADVIATNLRPDATSDRITALTDIFGSSTFYVATKYWTTADKNALTVSLSGPILLNRLELFAIGVVLISIAVAVFRFDAQPRSWRRKRAAAPIPDVAVADAGTLRLPTVTRRFDTRLVWRELLETTSFTFSWIVRGVAFLSITLIAAFGVVMTAVTATNKFNHTIYPLTYVMNEVTLSLLSLFLLVLVTVYAGELVWHDRQIGASELVDAAPVAPLTVMTGRLMALLGAVTLLLLATIVVGMAVQTGKGYTHYELPVYLKFVFLTEVPRVVSLVLFAFFMHTVVNNKYVGHLVMIVLVGGMVQLDTMGWTHRLYQLGRTPVFQYSDLNGFGPYVPKLAWYALYWTAFGVLLFIIAALFWVRGTGAGRRGTLARQRFKGPMRAAAGVSGFATVTCGAVIFYNTNILERYETDSTTNALKERYERGFRQYEHLPEVVLVGMKLRTDLVPERLSYTVAGRQDWMNQSSRPVDTLILNMNEQPRSPNTHVDSLRISRATRVVKEDSGAGVHMLVLSPPVMPGDTFSVTFAAHYTKRGFSNDKGDNAIADNGSFITTSLLPSFGYDAGSEITDPDVRRKHHLPTNGGRMNRMRDTLVHQTPPDPNIAYDATVSTAPDQMVVSPGTLDSTWMEAGRRVFHFSGHGAAQMTHVVVSGRLAEKKDVWTDPSTGKRVALSVFYHPGHPYDVDRLLRAEQRAIDYGSANFGPYQYDQFRIVEYPRYTGYSYAFAATIPFSEDHGFIARVKPEPAALDFPMLIAAHELGHQWWGLQVGGAPVEGSRMLNESLAQYTSLMVLRKTYGDVPVRKVLFNMMDNYLNGRSNERTAEQPLMYNQGQDYLVYGKGGLAMNALADYIGEDRVNRALKQFVLKYRPPHPAPSTVNFVSELRAVTPDSLQYVITDLFETITLFDNRADSASATKRPDGKYAVRLFLNARKFHADSAGADHETELNDLMDVGVFGAPTKDDPFGKPLYLAKRRFVDRRTVIDLIVDEKPLKAGIDPYNKLIDRNSPDNLTAVRLP